MVTEKLKRYMSLRHSTSASQLDAQKPADKIRAAHLEEGRGGRRPASWRESEITRTKGEARSIIRGHEARIKRGEISLGELAMSQSESDCSSACKRGDLGYFGSAGLAVRRASDGEVYWPQKEASAESLCNPSLGHMEVRSRTS
ncbi:peptidyl-prolyl cis-trans isomerase ssp-1 [Apiospora arundinis]